MCNELFVAIIAENDKIMMDERLCTAMTYWNFIEDYLFSKHNMNKKTKLQWQWQLITYGQLDLSMNNTLWNWLAIVKYFQLDEILSN